MKHHPFSNKNPMRTFVACIAAVLLLFACDGESGSLPTFIPDGADMYYVLASPQALLANVRTIFVTEGLDLELLGMPFDEFVGSEDSPFAGFVNEIAPGKAIVVTAAKKPRDIDYDVVVYLPVKNGGDSAATLADTIGLEEGAWKVYEGYMVFGSGSRLPLLPAQSVRDLSFAKSYSPSAVTIDFDVDMFEEINNGETGVTMDSMVMALDILPEGLKFDAHVGVEPTAEWKEFLAACGTSADARTLAPSMSAESFLSTAFTIGSDVEPDMFIDAVFQAMSGYVSEETKQLLGSSSTKSVEGMFSVFLDGDSYPDFDSTPQYYDYAETAQGRRKLVRDSVDWIRENFPLGIAYMERDADSPLLVRFLDTLDGLNSELNPFADFDKDSYAIETSAASDTGYETTTAELRDFGSETPEEQLVLGAFVSYLRENAKVIGDRRYGMLGDVSYDAEFLKTGKAGTPVTGTGTYKSFVAGDGDKLFWILYLRLPALLRIVSPGMDDGMFGESAMITTGIKGDVVHLGVYTDNGIYRGLLSLLNF